MQKPGGTDWARPESGLSISISRQIVAAERDVESFSLQSATGDVARITKQPLSTIACAQLSLIHWCSDTIAYSTIPAPHISMCSTETINHITDFVPTLLRLTLIYWMQAKIESNSNE